MAQGPGWSATSASTRVDSAAAKRRVPNLHRSPPSSSLPGATRRSSSSGEESCRRGAGPRAVWRRRRSSGSPGFRHDLRLCRSSLHRPGTSVLKHASSWSHSHFFAETGGRGHAIVLWLVRPEDRRGVPSYHTAVIAFVAHRAPKPPRRAQSHTTPTVTRAVPDRGARKKTEAWNFARHDGQLTPTILPDSASESIIVSCGARQAGQVQLMSWVPAALIACALPNQPRRTLRQRACQDGDGGGSSAFPLENTGDP